MKYRLRLWLLFLLVLAVCAGIIFGIAALRSRRHANPELVSRLPAEGAVILSVDFAALRRGGLLKVLASSGVAQEPEYRSFVNETGFDYLHDLDSVAVSFHRSGTYFLLQGRFDWKALKDYAAHQGGDCYNMYCKVRGSTDDRRISFCPLRPDVMALAVSRDGAAAFNLSLSQKGPKLATPSDPLWAIVPMAALRESSSLPAGTRMFVSALRGTETMVLSLGYEGAGMRFRADVSCRSAADAAALAAQLSTATGRLRSLIARENQAPNPADLSGVLAGGVFEQKGDHVVGRWPVAHALLESLAGSGL